MSLIFFQKDLTFNGCRILRLQNDLLQIDVLPELGGKIYNLLHKPENRQYLWHNPQIKPVLVTPGTSFDDKFAGGWDEQFPSDEPCRHQGKNYPDHGELWTQNADWEIEQSDDSLTLYTCVETPITKCRMERWLTMSADSTAIRFRHRLTNLSQSSFDYLWKFHPALTLSPSFEIIIPAGAGIIAEPGSGRLSADQLELTWPMVPTRDGSTIDMSKLPADIDKIDSGPPGYEMVYLTELHAGWYAILDRATRSGFAMAFDTKVFDNLWVFQSLGGWQGMHVLVIEPSTGYPYNLAKAAATGRVAQLKAGQILETETSAIILTNRDNIENISLDGTVG